MIEARGVGKRYGRGGWVLDGIDLAVAPGESVAVLGSNGSGKSTLLRLLAGVSRPTRGTVTTGAAVLGYVPDQFTATDAMSSVAYLTHLGRVRGLRTPAATRRARDLLARLELAGGLRTPIRALSKGNVQKVVLAQALLVPPDLLLLDEPWSGLDTSAHDVLGDLLHEVVGRGGSVVLTDHHEAVARAHATVSYTVTGGRLVPA